MKPGHAFVHFLIKNPKYVRTAAKYFFTFLMIIPFAAFAQRDSCKIIIRIKNPETNYEASYLTPDKQESATLKDSLFVFNEVIEKPHIGQFSIGKTGSGKATFVFLYLTPGIVRAEISLDSAFHLRVISPAISREYQEKLLDRVNSYAAQRYRAHVAYVNAQKQGSADTTALKVAMNEANIKCFGVPQAYVKANPGSPLCIVALEMLGDGKGKGSPASLNDLNNLYNGLPDSIKNSPDGLQYAEMLKKWALAPVVGNNTTGKLYITDGPYLFYHSGEVISKNISLKDGQPQAAADSFPEKERTQHQLTVHLAGHSEWDFTVKLKAQNVPRSPVCQGAEKTLILSDIEGEFEPFRNLLLAAKVIDDKYNWTFGKGRLIVAGDLFDRGKQVCQFLWLLYKLEDEARAKGGDVNVVLGNHDIMNLGGDFRYVEPEYMNNAALMNQSYTDLYAANTELGRWLRSKNTIEKIGNLLVMHGGMSREVLDRQIPLSAINDDCRSYYGATYDHIPDSLKLFFYDKALFWYRGYFLEPKATQGLVDSTLAFYDCKKIIVGHDIIDHVNSFYGGKVVGVDVDEHEGTHEALLIDKYKYYRIDDKGSKTLILN